MKTGAISKKSQNMVNHMKFGVQGAKKSHVCMQSKAVTWTVKEVTSIYTSTLFACNNHE